MCGSYEALDGGSMVEALEDFTGGIKEVFKWKEDPVPSNLFQVMQNANQHCSLMGSAISVCLSSIHLLNYYTD